MKRSIVATDKGPTKRIKRPGPTEADANALADIRVEDLPPALNPVLEAAVQEFDEDLLVSTKRPFPSLRKQGTASMGGGGEYKFSGAVCKVQPCGPNTATLIRFFAHMCGAEDNKVWVHLNWYPADTQSGVQPHRDDAMFDPNYPISGMQLYGNADLVIWNGTPADAKTRNGAKREVRPGTMYTMPPNFQSRATHAIERRKTQHMQVKRCSLTFRVIL